MWRLEFGDRTYQSRRLGISNHCSTLLHKMAMTLPWEDYGSVDSQFGQGELYIKNESLSQ